MENKALDCAGESTTDKNFDKPISTSQHSVILFSVWHKYLLMAHVFRENA